MADIATNRFVKRDDARTELKAIKNDLERDIHATRTDLENQISMLRVETETEFVKTRADLTHPMTPDDPDSIRVDVGLAVAAAAFT